MPIDSLPSGLVATGAFYTLEDQDSTFGLLGVALLLGFDLRSHEVSRPHQDHEERSDEPLAPKARPHEGQSPSHVI